MGCGNCGTGKPNGCKSNGGCNTGSCNRMNVHDWLWNLPMSDTDSACKIVEVSFNQGSRKDYYRNASLQYFEKGDMVTIEGVNGFDVGEVSLTGELVRLQLKKKNISEFGIDMKKILRLSNERDLELFHKNKAREKEALMKSRIIAKNLNLDMKLIEVEIQADGKKGTFFYTADDRVDFRELIKQYAGEFKLKIEMRQVGIRQGAAKVGGIGSCGRELCCSTWLTDFKSVTTTAARYQNLSINQTKLSGQCGRLKCCLNYELDTYLDALQYFPDNADVLETAKGTAILIKKDIFKNLMWYILQGGAKHYPLTIRRVKEIKQLNAKGIKVDDLQPVELAPAKEVEHGFVDVVGHLTIGNLEKTSQRNKEKQRQQRREGQGKQPQQQHQKKGQQQGPASQKNQQQKLQQQRPSHYQKPGKPQLRPPQNPNQPKNKPPQKRDS
ncbi:PSP1 domain-containing protein [Parafilimonas terrae]|uniref:Cell fate regulator YaaT, PSP1 superfamily (Controls sporulation, competence, biofilm development) n=1 Tax=Parafilimonas terrae TaxID=1465490 RepID=A0A1I5VWN5_9BACT|nr:regulatory iron-sulfur-containing complex subunit RicT [Parafilimonas terrae]SFQ11406.1 Cell fate regulator YaaT, PSP1 superfamily (controls sporulation, competence, biofilm development) [Parafilimonas terrae]